MLLDERIGSLPKGHSAPVAHVIACVKGCHAVELLIDHDDRERVACTVVLNPWRSILAYCQYNVGSLIAFGIHQFVVGIYRNEMNLSHTYSRHNVHVPTECELDGTRTCLAVEHDAEVGTCEFVLILRVEEPSLTLAFVFCLLGFGEVALVRILYAANLALYIGRDDALEGTLVV